MLDAEWRDHLRGQHDSPFCSGWCASVCAATASDPLRMAHILHFALCCESGSIVCDHGKHRTLSAALILELFFHRAVDYRFASGSHSCPCGKPATEGVGRISAALRSSERYTHRSNLLPEILGLP